GRSRRSSCWSRSAAPRPTSVSSSRIPRRPPISCGISASPAATADMPGDPWQKAFLDYSGTSFIELLRQAAPEFLPGRLEIPRAPTDALSVPDGTTVLALRYRDGVIMAGDRQASEGYQVASRRIEKIFKTDDLSGVGIAGAAGPAMEMARLFQTELEHYEKVEGDNLSL